MEISIYLYECEFLMKLAFLKIFIGYSKFGLNHSTANLQIWQIDNTYDQIN